MSLITARLGRQLFLNGSDEYARIPDASISPSGAFDVDASATVGGLTLGIFFERAYGDVRRRQVLMSKRNDGDAAADAGWLLELTEDDEVRLLLDDGTVQVELTSGAANTIEDDGLFHGILITIDYANDVATLWLTRGRDTEQITEISTASISTLGDCSNTEDFSLGALYDGAAASLFFNGGIAWAVVFDEVLQDDELRGAIRWQFPFPEDRRCVSCYHFNELDSDDWNRVNANDLTEAGITSANFLPGPERFPEVSSVEAVPSFGAGAGSFRADFARFRPQPLAEAYFYEAGIAKAPPLRLRRITRGAGTEPTYGLGLGGEFAAVRGRLALGDDIPSGSNRRILSFVVPSELTEDLGEPVGGWQFSDSLADAKFESLEPTCDFDRDGNPQEAYIVSSESGGARWLIVLNVSDPTNLSITGSLDYSATAASGVGTPVTDARGNGYVWGVSRSADLVIGFDVSTPATPVVGGSVSDARLDGGLNFVQISDRLYVPLDTGLMSVDISTPASPSIAGLGQTDPGGSENDGSTLAVILQNQRILTIGTAHDGGFVLIVWDVSGSTNKDTPEPILRVAESSTAAGDVPTRIDANLADIPGGIDFRTVHRRGAVVFFGTGSGSDHHLHAITVADPNEPRFLANYDLSDYIPGSSGVQAVFSYDRSSFFIYTNGGGAGRQLFALFRFDEGLGRTALELDYPAPASTVENAFEVYELYKILNDLGDGEFEGQTVGVAPSNWTKVGGASSTILVANGGLTGDFPAGSPLCMELDIGGADTSVGAQHAITPAAGDLEAGTVYQASLWIRVEGNEAFDPATDLDVTLTEAGGTASVSTSAVVTATKRYRWHRVEINHILQFDDSTTLRLTITLQDSSTNTMKVDNVRIGRAKVPELVIGRCLTASGTGNNPGAIPVRYTAEFTDTKTDLDRLEVTASFDATSVATQIKSLVSNNTRSKDAFDTSNVFDELGNADGEDAWEKEKLSTILDELAEKYEFEWWLVGRFLWVVPSFWSAAPTPINDDPDSGSYFFDLDDEENGGEFVTNGEIEGDQGQMKRHSATFTDSNAEAIFGRYEASVDPNQGIRTASKATDVADFYKSTFADRERTGQFSIYEEPRFRPGQVIPVQLPFRGLDRTSAIQSIRYGVDRSGARFVSHVTFGVIRRQGFGLIFSQRDRKNQREKVQVPEQVESLDGWQV